MKNSILILAGALAFIHTADTVRAQPAQGEFAPTAAFATVPPQESIRPHPPAGFTLGLQARLGARLPGDQDSYFQLKAGPAASLAFRAGWRFGFMAEWNLWTAVKQYDADWETYPNHPDEDLSVNELSLGIYYQFPINRMTLRPVVGVLGWGRSQEDHVMLGFHAGMQGLYEINDRLDALLDLRGQYISNFNPGGESLSYTSWIISAGIEYAL